MVTTQYVFAGQTYPFLEIEEIKETHLSLVFIGKDYVYKLKKPERFSFVDYSSVERRRSSAFDELTLNRRTTSGVYLGVSFLVLRGTHWEYTNYSALTRSEGPGDEGEPVVVMRRLRDSDALSALVRRDSLDLATHLAQAAKLLADFHKHYKVAPSPEKYLAATEASISDNFTDLAKFAFLSNDAQEVLAELSQAARTRLSDQRALLLKRLAEGAVVDGHGDLRLDHLYFESKGRFRDRVQIIDCLEFSEELRRVDRASDVGFLSMSLDFSLRADLGSRLESEYERFAGDPSFREILSLFKLYRALVRAKVHSLRATQLEAVASEEERQRAESYIALAGRYALGIQRPTMVIVCGLMGSGKSTVARRLCSTVYGIHLRSDAIRKERFAADVDGGKGADFGEGLYSPEITDATYTAMNELARSHLEHGNVVILDATFSRRRYREAAYETARATAAEVVVLECRLEREIALRRIAKRAAESSDISDARPELYDRQRSSWEAILPEEGAPYHVVSTASPVTERQLWNLLAAARGQNDPRPQE